LREKNEQVKFFADRVTMGSLSMRSLWIQSSPSAAQQTVFGNKNADR